MQVQMQAFSRESSSLRALITQDLNRHRHDVLYVEASKNVGRPKGWAKIKARDIYGAINIEWDADQRMLIGRAIAKNGNTPDELLGIFVGYLIAGHGKRIGSVNIQLR